MSVGRPIATSNPNTSPATVNLKPCRCNDSALHTLQCCHRHGRWSGWGRAVFFNLFAAAEPSTNVCVAHGTLWKDPSTQAHNQEAKPPARFLTPLEKYIVHSLKS